MSTPEWTEEDRLWMKHADNPTVKRALVHIDCLTAERDSFQRVGIATLERAEDAEAKLAEARAQFAEENRDALEQEARARKAEADLATERDKADMAEFDMCQAEAALAAEREKVRALREAWEHLGPCASECRHCDLVRDEPENPADDPTIPLDRIGAPEEPKP